MRRNLYILAQCTFLLFITLLVNGCSLHEEPEMTPEGELGTLRQRYHPLEKSELS